MTVTNAEKMLMEGLAHIRRQDKVILVFLVGVMNTKAFSGAVSKSRYNVTFYYFRTFILFIFFYSEWTVGCVLDSVVVVDSLILETWRLWNISCRYKALYGSNKRVGDWLVNLFCNFFLGLNGLDNLSKIFTH
jgi:hypothetical protein